jgi:hypothetical protein
VPNSFVVAPLWGVNVTVVQVEAPAAVAMASGSAAATSTAPAATALTKIRGIRLEVFIKNPSLEVLLIFTFTPYFLGLTLINLLFSDDAIQPNSSQGRAS